MKFPASFFFWLKKNQLHLLVGIEIFSLIFFFFFGLLVIAPNKNLQKQKVLGFRELLPTPVPYPVNRNAFPSPEISGQAAIVVDFNSLAVLYQKNPDLRLFPASLTKIMTAVIAMENYPLTEVLTISDTKVEGNVINLVPDEQMTVENLLYGLLVPSGNDAATVLAENFPQGINGFVWAMNQKAQELKMENTHFTNPVGLDEKDHYSSARDLMRLTMVALKNPVFAKIVSTPEIEITDISGKIIHQLKSTNELLGKVPGIKGVKTGWTENAGECLLSLTQRDGHEIMTVVLDSQNRFGETEALIEWAFKNFDWQSIHSSYH